MLKVNGMIVATRATVSSITSWFVGVNGMHPCYAGSTLVPFDSRRFFLCLIFDHRDCSPPHLPSTAVHERLSYDSFLLSPILASMGRVIDYRFYMSTHFYRTFFSLTSYVTGSIDTAWPLATPTRYKATNSRHRIIMIQQLGFLSLLASPHQHVLLRFY